MVKSSRSPTLARRTLRKTGANVVVAEDGGLPYARARDPLLDPIAMIQTTYLAIERMLAGLRLTDTADGLVQLVHGGAHTAADLRRIEGGGGNGGEPAGSPLGQSS